MTKTTLTRKADVAKESNLFTEMLDKSTLWRRQWRQNCQSKINSQDKLIIALSKSALNDIIGTM